MHARLDSPLPRARALRFRALRFCAQRFTLAGSLRGPNSSWISVQKYFSRKTFSRLMEKWRRVLRSCCAARYVKIIHLLHAAQWSATPLTRILSRGEHRSGREEVRAKRFEDLWARQVRGKRRALTQALVRPRFPRGVIFTLWQVGPANQELEIRLRSSLAAGSRSSIGAVSNHFFNDIFKVVLRRQRQPRVDFCN